ncbi:hypothetical protein BOTBODRAFT_173512 [Botryobasidium botryosum FD-172 SS1]|uniref:Uncharacterized protein n=1 Tax=Botryobasidium botryosum (strain FD-172 SS1) TaxID=930990 RepID=A0A067MJZ5_BOTB1|nr:hypothetical protein BOTBODRAFT_173512 [Botryobasidium botryosum FD-172 SS1]
MVRFKNRWFLVEFIRCETTTDGGRRPATVSSKQIWNALKDSVLLNFGDAGWGAVGGSLNVKYFSPVTNLCIIRVGRDNHQIAWGAITLLTTLENERFIPHVVHCSGTIKKVQQAAIRHNREVVGRLRARLKAVESYQPHASLPQTDDEAEEYLSRTAKEIESLQD